MASGTVWLGCEKGAAREAVTLSLPLPEPEQVLGLTPGATVGGTLSSLRLSVPPNVGTDLHCSKEPGGGEASSHPHMPQSDTSHPTEQTGFTPPSMKGAHKPPTRARAGFPPQCRKDAPRQSSRDTPQGLQAVAGKILS